VQRRDDGEFEPSDALPFVGHFVVLCGVDTISRKIVFRDPANWRGGYCAVPIPDFERARRRRGTDEDLIEVVLSE
jgi:hypothetical protein